MSTVQTDAKSPKSKGVYADRCDFVKIAELEDGPRLSKSSSSKTKLPCTVDVDKRLLVDTTSRSTGRKNARIA